MYGAVLCFVSTLLILFPETSQTTTVYKCGTSKFLINLKYFTNLILILKFRILINIALFYIVNSSIHPSISVFFKILTIVIIVFRTETHWHITIFMVQHFIF